MKHASHLDVVKRLKRANGHLTSVIAMIEEGRPCVDLAMQLQAVEKAVIQASHPELLPDHPHLQEGSGRVHAHPIVIDALHPA